MFEPEGTGLILCSRKASKGSFVATPLSLVGALPKLVSVLLCPDPRSWLPVLSLPALARRSSPHRVLLCSSRFP